MSSFSSSSTRANHGSQSPPPAKGNVNGQVPLGLGVGAPRFGTQLLSQPQAQSQAAPSASGTGAGPLFHIKTYNNYGPTHVYVGNPDTPDVIVVNGMRVLPGPAPGIGQQGQGLGRAQGHAPVAPGTPRPAPGTPRPAPGSPDFYNSPALSLSPRGDTTR